MIPTDKLSLWVGAGSIRRKMDIHQGLEGCCGICIPHTLYRCFRDAIRNASPIHRDLETTSNSDNKIGPLVKPIESHVAYIGGCESSAIDMPIFHDGKLSYRTS